MKGKIVVVPMGDFDFYLVNKLATALSTMFAVPVDILQGMKIPQEAYNWERGQYYSTVILSKLELLKANERERVLGVVDEDLYVPALNFVFGESDRLASVAVISVYRLRQDLFSSGDDDRLIYQRMLKEAVHELGHIYGLSHCNNLKCVMYFSNSMLDTDRKSEKFCDVCIRRLSN